MLELKLQLRYNLPMWFIMLITSWLPDNKFVFRLRGKLASFFIKKCGRNFQIGKDVTLLNPFNLEVGNDVYIAKGCWFNALGGLKIDDEVLIAPYVVISTMQHVYKNSSFRFSGSIADKVLIESGCWIASHSSIKCGVTIGKGSLVASNASVVKDVVAHTIVGGVPAKYIKEVEEGEANIFSKTDLLNNV